ncbi:hypothetical protein SLS62_003391 [Diatrype stigma]|uniref:S-adenosyl-L-methionine-dependent methyltransferase n=1 Tax=Diatrype stigma TaxID=117547 RepID=A0AAN9YPY5_9PEZI
MTEQAATYDSRHEKLAERLTAELRSRLDLIGVDWVDDDDDDDEDDEEDEDRGKDEPSQLDRKMPLDVEGAKGEKKQKKHVRLLDYAGGTGMMSRAFAPYVTQCVSIDLSENMVAAYNARARNQGISEDEMFAVVGDLVSASDPDPPGLSPPQFRDFDIAVVGGGLHHFADPALAAARLVARLKPGGVLLIWDFMAPRDDDDEDGGRGGDHGEDGSGDNDAGASVAQQWQQAHHTITQHHGFTERGIREIYEKAGAGQNFTLVDLGAGFMFGHGSGHATDKEDREKMRRRVFLSWGEKVGVS